MHCKQKDSNFLWKHKGGNANNDLSGFWQFSSGKIAVFCFWNIQTNCGKRKQYTLNQPLLMYRQIYPTNYVNMPYIWHSACQNISSICARDVLKGLGGIWEVSSANPSKRKKAFRIVVFHHNLITHSSRTTPITTAEGANETTAV